MSTDGDTISLRVRVSSGDGPVIVDITGPGMPENGLQAIGDWVPAALEQHADGAAGAARPMVAALRERDWEGDVELADQLDALLADAGYYVRLGERRMAHLEAVRGRRV
jgi:hypothetical protein